MQQQITGLTLWNSWGALQRLAGLTAPGEVRYALKKILRALEPHWKDILEFIAEDRAEHGWEAQPNGLPVFPNDFYGRFEALLNKEITVELHAFSEESMRYVDGLSTSDELVLSFLFKPVESVEPAKPIEPPTP